MKKDNLTASEAIYGFCAWLTTRPKRTIMSASDDAAPIVELITKFCDVNGLKEPKSDYHLCLLHPEEATEDVTSFII